MTENTSSFDFQNSIFMAGQIELFAFSSKFIMHRVVRKFALSLAARDVAIAQLIEWL